jgi:hypothetical protein
MIIIRGFLILIYSLASFIYSKAQVKVVERGEAMQIVPGYSILESYSLFEFRKHKYLIVTKEFFDDHEEIRRVSILKSEGYVEFSKDEFGKLNHFLEIHGFSKNIKATLVDDHHLIINKEKFLVERIDKKQKRIFYTSAGKKGAVYYLVYK